MNDTTKKILLWTGIPLLVLAIIFILIFGKQIGLPLSVGSGFTTLSLSQISVNSNDPNIAGQVWDMSVSENGAGQTASLTTDISSSSGQKSNQFTLSTAINKNYLSYPIYTTPNSIYTVDYTTTSRSLTSYFAGNNFQYSGCNSAVWDYAQFTGGVGSTVYCYKFTKLADYGQIQPGNVNFESTITVSGTGGSDSCTISNIGATSCYSSYGNMYATWVGSLVSGQATPDLSKLGFDAVFNTGSLSGGWTLGSQYAWNSYYSYDQSGFRTCLNNPPNGDYQSCFTNYKNYATQASQPLAQSISGIAGLPQTTGQESNGQIIINMPMQVQFPLINMRISASLIGINIPVGKPQLSGLSIPTSFVSGQVNSGNIYGTIKNVGTGTGDFQISAICNNQVTQANSYPLTVSSLPVGDTNQFQIPLVGNVQQSGNFQCTVTAIDVNDPTMTSTATVTGTIKAPSICTNGQTITQGQNILICENNKYVVEKSCPTGTNPAMYNNGTAYCSTITPPGGNKTQVCQPVQIVPPIKGITSGYSIPNYPCLISNWFANLIKSIGTFLFIIEVIVTLLISIFVLIASKGLFEEHTKLKPALVWIFSLAIAFLAGWLVFTIFWIGIIASIIFLIIKGFLPEGKLRRLVGK